VQGLLIKQALFFYAPRDETSPSSYPISKHFLYVAKCPFYVWKISTNGDILKDKALMST